MAGPDRSLKFHSATVDVATAEAPPAVAAVAVLEQAGRLTVVDLDLPVATGRRRLALLGHVARDARGLEPHRDGELSRARVEPRVVLDDHQVRSRRGRRAGREPVRGPAVDPG